MKQPDEFKIPEAEYPDAIRLIEEVLRTQKARFTDQQGDPNRVRDAIPQNLVGCMADIATNAWKAKTKMVHAASGEVRDEMKRVYRHVEAVLDALHEVGLEVKDHTGDPFDYGLPLKVVTTQPTSGISRESVVETIKPTIYWHQQLIQMGEVVIATPSAIEAKK